MKKYVPLKFTLINVINCNGCLCEIGVHGNNPITVWLNICFYVAPARSPFVHAIFLYGHQEFYLFIMEGGHLTHMQINKAANKMYLSAHIKKLCLDWLDCTIKSRLRPRQHSWNGQLEPWVVVPNEGKSVTPILGLREKTHFGWHCLITLTCKTCKLDGMRIKKL